MMCCRNDVCAMRKMMCRRRGNAGSRDDLNALRCALGTHSGKIILNSAMPGSLRAVRHCIFTGEGAEGNGSCSAAQMFPQETSAAAAVYLYDPTRENGIAERPQTLRYPEIINNDSADDAQSNAERIPNRLILQYLLLWR
jgi:hypothetical protein